MIVIEKDNWVAWKKNPVTQLVIKTILEKREAIKEGIAEGHSENLERDIGRTMAIIDVVTYMLEEVIQDGEQNND